MAAKLVVNRDGTKRTIIINHNHTFTKNELLLAKKETQCSICLDDQEEDRTYMVLDCDHIFHTGCILKWLSANENHSCPLCRHDQVDQFKTREDCHWLDQALYSVTKELTQVDKQKNKQCYICRDQIEDDRWFELKCGHIWHHSCFKTWINKRNVCPLDNRTPIYQ